MVYHSQLDLTGVRIVCGLPLVPLENGFAANDPVEEALYFYRCNVLFQKFVPAGPADILLMYSILYVSSCLNRIQSMANQDAAQVKQTLFQKAHGPLHLPGEPHFVLGGLVSPPQDEEERLEVQEYLTDLRLQLGDALTTRLYADEHSKPDKFWMAFGGSMRFAQRTLLE